MEISRLTQLVEKTDQSQQHKRHNLQQQQQKYKHEELLVIKREIKLVEILRSMQLWNVIV